MLQGPCGSHTIKCRNLKKRAKHRATGISSRFRSHRRSHRLCHVVSARPASPLMGNRYLHLSNAPLVLTASGCSWQPLLSKTAYLRRNMRRSAWTRSTKRRIGCPATSAHCGNIRASSATSVRSSIAGNGPHGMIRSNSAASLNRSSETSRDSSPPKSSSQAVGIANRGDTTVYLTTHDAMTLVGVSRATLHRWVRKGLPCHRPGGCGRPRYLASEIHAFLRADETSHSSSPITEITG